MRVQAVQQLALAVRQRADLGGQQNAFGGNSQDNVSDTEMLTTLNGSYSEWWDLTIAAYGDNYAWSVYPLPVVPGVYQYQVPFDFYKEYGVDIGLDSSLQNWGTVRPYSLRDRNQFSFPLQTALAAAGWQNQRWSIQGQIIDFQPKLGPVPGNMRLLYAPTCPILVPALPAAWVASGTHAQGDLVTASVTTNGATATQVFAALNAGTSASGAPPWAVPGVTTDNNIVWAYQGPLSLFSVTMDGINGGDDYLILDACIKLGTKQEMDVSPFVAQKAALVQRFTRMLPNRSSGDPMVLSGGFGMAEGGPAYGNGFGSGSAGSS